MPDYITSDPVLLVVGLFYVSMGFSLTLTPAPWQKLVTMFEESDVAVLLSGIFALFVGLIITVFFADWSMPGRVLLTVVGYIALAEGVCFLFFAEAVRKFVASPFYQGLFKISGVLSVAFGLLFLVL